MTLPQAIQALVDALCATTLSIYEDEKVRNVPISEYFNPFRIVMYIGPTFPDTGIASCSYRIHIDKILLAPPLMEPIWIDLKEIGRDLVNDCIRRWNNGGYEAGAIPIGLFSRINQHWLCMLHYSCGCGENTFTFKFVQVTNGDEKHTCEEGASGYLVGPFLEAPRKLLPPLNVLNRIAEMHNVDRFALRDLSATPHEPDDRFGAIEWFFAHKGGTMVSDPKVYKTGPVRCLPTSASRYETIWEESYDQLPCSVAIFWDRESNQYLRLMALDVSNNFKYTNDGGGGGMTFGGWTGINCILESIAINPLAQAVVWKDRSKKHVIFTNEILATCRCILKPLCALIASFTF